MRVLLIEDDSATAQSIELMLKSEGFNVYTTDLGEEGVDLGKIYDYDLILLDLNLPDMSGIEVLRSLRVGKVDTPIMILSGTSEIDTKVKTFSGGADDYMTKPFHKDELVARIHAVDAGDQFVLVERLGHVVVGAAGEGLDLGVDLRGARQDHDRGVDLADTQAAQHLDAAHVGQIQVEQDEIVIVDLAQIDAFLTQVRRVDVEAFGLQHQFDALRGRAVIFDQQY